MMHTLLVSLILILARVSRWAPERQKLNAVEIEEAVSQLADQPFDAKNCPYSFLEAFGNKDTTH